jgi:outer membrane protease
MRRLPVVFLLMLILQAASIQAQSHTEFSCNGVAMSEFGNSTYELRASYYEDDVLKSIKSKLEFPLDVFIVGAEFRALHWRNDRPRWEVMAGLYASVSDPSSVMKDSDWIKDESTPYRKFSYTESDVKMSSTIMRAEASYWLLRWGHFNFAVTAGYRYQHIKQDLIGYEGWQLRDNGDSVSISGTERGIFYTISYNLPSAGVRALYTTDGNFRMDLRAAYVQAFASDHDDHLLRNKVGVADVVGAGVNGYVSARRYLTKSGKRKPYVELSADLLYLDATGDQTQTWYGDDPASPEDDTGSVASGIPHDVTGLQLKLALRFGLSF